MEEIKEEWRDIPFYEGLYQVSTKGNVKSLNYRRSGKEKILKIGKDRNGYIHLTLYKNKKVKCFRVHKLVALAFIPNDNPTEKTEVNHIDENKENNCANNLCWCSHIENINHATRNERVSEKMKGKPKSEEHKQKLRKPKSEETKQKMSVAHKEKMSGENNPFYGKHHTDESKKKISKAISKPIIQYTKDMVFIREWDSATQASTELNLSRGNITACCKEKLKSVGGFCWCYK